MRYAFRQFFSGLRQRKQVRFLAMARVLPTFTVSVRKSWQRYFRGTKPSDIPVEQPHRYELVVNLKAAQAMGCQLAPGLLLRADKLIE